MTVRDVTSGAGRVREDLRDTIVMAMTSVRAGGVTIDGAGREARIPRNYSPYVRELSKSPERTNYLVWIGWLTVIYILVSAIGSG